MRLTSIFFGKVGKELGEVSKKYANLPDEYVARTMQQVFWKTPRKVQYTDKSVERRKWRYTTNRPWTGQFFMQNVYGSIRKKVFVEPIRELTERLESIVRY